MSARQQAGQLRSIIARNLQQARVREAAANVLKGKGQVASGNLVSKILKKKDSQMFSISFKIDKEFDVIYDVRVVYDFDRLGVPYYRRLDRVLGREKASPPMRVSTGAISKWIGQKLANGTWKGSSVYTMKKKGKEYNYPISKLVYRKALAFVIARTINEDQILETRSPYITIARVQVIRALSKSESEFAEVWPEVFLNNIERKLTILF